MRWFFEAALRKDVDALWELACGYKRSREIPNNYEKGKILQRIAADHGQMFANIAESAFKNLDNTKKIKKNIRNYWIKLLDNTQKNDEEKKYYASELIKIVEDEVVLKYNVKLVPWQQKNLDNLKRIVNS